MGGASIHRAIFCHEAKVLYSSSNGGLNSPDSCIHCLVTLCAAGFVPPHFMQAPITSGFLFLHSVAKSSTIFFFFPSHHSAIFIPVSSKFSSDGDDAEGCEKWAPSHSDDYFNGKSPPFNVAGSWKCAKGHILLEFPWRSTADFKELYASRFSTEQVTVIFFNNHLNRRPKQNQILLLVQAAEKVRNVSSKYFKPAQWHTRTKSKPCGANMHSFICYVGMRGVHCSSGRHVTPDLSYLEIIKSKPSCKLLFISFRIPWTMHNKYDSLN